MSDIDDLFENLGFGKMQYIISFCCFTLQLWITNEQLGFGVVVAGATCELHIDDERLAWLMAGNFAAQMISCYVWGELSDAYGRRKIILSAATTANCLSILSACMPEYWSFLAVRTMAGLFISGAVVCVMTYLGEFTKITLRPTVLNFMSYAIGISLIYVPSLAGGLLPLEIEPRPWRILLLSNQLPGIIGLTMLIFLPESPKYYLSVSEQEKALKVMERVCRMNKGKDVTLVSMGVSSLSQLRMRNKADNQRRWHDIKVLFARHGKIMLSFLFVVFSLSGLAFSLPFWMLRIRVLTAHEKEPQTMCDLLDGKSKEGGNRMVHKCHLDFDEMLDPIIHGCVVLSLFIVTSFLLIFLNRRMVIFVYIFIPILGSFALNFSKHPTLILISFFALMDPPMCSIRLCLSLLIDLVPTHLRGKAIALTVMMGRCGVLSASLYVGYTLRYNCYVTFNLFIVMLIICGILVYFLPEEYRMRSIAQ